MYAIITRLSIDTLLSSSLRIVWGFLSGPRLLLHCSNERSEYYVARGKPLWRHNGFRHQCTVMTKQTSAFLVSDALTMQLNVVKAITESSAVSLLTKTKWYGYADHARRLYQGQFRAKHWRNSNAFYLTYTTNQFECCLHVWPDVFKGNT